MIYFVAMEVGYEAREEPAGDSFTGAIESVVEYEVRGEREVNERGGGFPAKENDGAGDGA